MQKGRYKIHLAAGEGWDACNYTIDIGSNAARFAKIFARNDGHTALEGDKISIATIVVGGFPQLDSGHTLTRPIERVERL